MRITAFVVAAVACAASGCLAVESATEAENQEPIEGYGLHVLAPEGWSGRVSWPGPGYAITLEATTAELPPAGTYVTAALLDDDDAYVVIDDIGPPPDGIGREAAWTVDPALPLAITPADIQGPLKGGFPSGASLNVVIEGRALMIRIHFGSPPGSDEIREINDLLERLAVAAPAVR